MPRLIYIKLDGGVHTVHSNEACTSSAVVFTQKQGTPFDLSVAFCTAGAAGAVADLSGVNLSFKRTDRFDAGISSEITTPLNMRLLNPNYTISGSSGSTRYNFLTNLQSGLVQSDMLLDASTSYDVEITWTLTGSAQTYKTTKTLTFIIESAVYGGTENAPQAALSSSRVVFVDDNYDVLAAQGFNAHASLANAVAAAWALTPAPSIADPVIIRLGSLSTAGDATIPATAPTALIIQGQGKNASTAGTISFAADYAHAITMQGLTCQMDIARGGGGAQDINLLQANVTQITTEVVLAIDGDAASRVDLITINGIDGADGDNADGDSAATAGIAPVDTPTIILQGQVVIGQIIVNAADGGDGGDGNATYPLGKLSGAGASGGSLVMRGSTLVELVTVHVGNAGSRGTSFTGYSPPPGVVLGGSGIVVTYESPYAQVLEYSPPDGGIDADGGAPSTGQINPSISYTYPLQLPLLGGEPTAPVAGYVIYSEANTVKIKYKTGEITTLTGPLSKATIVSGDQIEFSLPGGGTGYIDFFRRP